MDIVVPGVELGQLSDFNASSGTYVRDDRIYASVVGCRKEFQQPTKAGDLITKIQVSRRKEPNAVPDVENIVTGKVVKVNPRFASLSIMVVGTTPCRENYQGIIRVQDVRATEKDKVQIYKSFRPGDIVRAEVISLGDARSYYLSTAKNDLGVIFAQSVAGHTMIPISWEEMICPKTK
ncbi:Exosome complex component CSL4, partial [Blyttiomyces sp. JEL0837]